jgi:hypothetical protein
MSFDSALQNFKEIITKARPESTHDIEIAVGKTLDNICTTLLNSRVARQNSIVPSVVKAAQEFAGMPSGTWSDSWFVKRITTKNLGNCANTIMNTWPDLNKNDVIEAVKTGARLWVERVIKENAE